MRPWVCFCWSRCDAAVAATQDRAFRERRWMPDTSAMEMPLDWGHQDVALTLGVAAWALTRCRGGGASASSKAGVSNRAASRPHVMPSLLQQGAESTCHHNMLSPSDSISHMLGSSTDMEFPSGHNTHNPYPLLTPPHPACASASSPHWHPPCLVILPHRKKTPPATPQGLLC